MRLYNADEQTTIPVRRDLVSPTQAGSGSVARRPRRPAKQTADEWTSSTILVESMIHFLCCRPTAAQPKQEENT